MAGAISNVVLVTRALAALPRNRFVLRTDVKCWKGGPRLPRRSPADSLARISRYHSSGLGIASGCRPRPDRADRDAQETGQRYVARPPRADLGRSDRGADRRAGLRADANSTDISTAVCGASVRCEDGEPMGRGSHG